LCSKIPETCLSVPILMYQVHLSLNIKTFSESAGINSLGSPRVVLPAQGRYIQGRQVLSVYVVPDPPSWAGTTSPFCTCRSRPFFLYRDDKSFLYMLFPTLLPAQGRGRHVVGPVVPVQGRVAGLVVPVPVRERHVHKQYLGCLTTTVYTESISKHSQSTWVNPLRMNKSRTLTCESLYQDILRVLL